MPEAGGNTRVSGGMITLPLSMDYARFLEIITFNCTEQEVIERFVEESLKTEDWIKGLGGQLTKFVSLRAYIPFQEAVDYANKPFAAERTKFMIKGVDFGTSIEDPPGKRLFRLLSTAVESRGIKVLASTPAKELIISEDVRIVGVVAEKEGYLSAERVLKGSELTIPMKKIRPFDVELVVHPYNSYANDWNPPRYQLRSAEKALVHVGLQGSRSDQYLEFPSNDTVLELVEGKEKYNIDITLTSLDNPVGGYTARGLEIGYADFVDADTIELHVFEYVPNPTTDQLRMDMYQFMINGNYTEKLRPVFK
jgi:hypothetical protein